MTSPTPLLDRITDRKAQEPVQITERMSPFMRRLAEKRLAPKNMTPGKPTGGWDAA
jgi:hypothetical protein